MVAVSGLVMGLAGLLALIAILPPLAERLHLPYTVMLALLGVAVGIGIAVADIGGIAEALAGIEAPEPMKEMLILALQVFDTLGDFSITSELFLWVFLPLLLFETAIALDARDLSDDVVAILVLAILAVGITTLFAGLALSWLGMPLVVALLLGSIVATTDPAAVVAIFREVGAPRRLTSLVEGESLLNDAAAIALFGAILAALVSAEIPPAGTIALDFVWASIGGGLFGALAGRLAAMLVSRLDQGGPAEVTLSVALAYLTFGVGEHFLHVSGVVAVVVAGLVFGTISRTRVGGREWDSVTTIWTQVGFWASSLIFVLATMLVPSTLLNAEPFDFLLLAALILATLLARAVTLFTILPALSHFSRQQPIDNRYKSVILWGGLRGAVTLALALSVVESPFVGEEPTNTVSVVATCFVLFTLLVQGTTLRPLITWLELDKPTGVERFLRSRVLALTHEEVRDELSAAAIDHGLDLASLPMFEPPSLDEEDAGFDDGTAERLLSEQLATAIATITSREMELYVEEVAYRMVSRSVGGGLVHDAQSLLDAVRSDGVAGYRRVARKQFETDFLTRMAIRLHRYTGYDRPLARILAMRIEHLLVQRRVVENLVGFNRRRIKTIFSERVAETAAAVLEFRMNAIERSLDAARLQYPSHWRAVSSQYLHRIALRLEYDGFRRLLNERLLTPRLFRHLGHELRNRFNRLDKPPALDLGLDLPTLVARVPLFRDLSDRRIREIAKLLRPRLVLPGERFIRRGSPGDAMYFIASGAVEVIVEPEPVRLGTGDFVGEMALLTRMPRRNDVRALGYCQLLELRRDAFGKFLEEHPELSDELWRVSDIRLRTSAPPVGTDPSG